MSLSQQPSRDKICTAWWPLVVPTALVSVTMDTLLFSVSSLRLISDDSQQKDNCHVPRHIWQRWIDRQQTEVLLVEILQRDVRHVLCVDGYHEQERDRIYVSQRYMSDLDQDEYVEVSVLKELPPLATKITLEPLDADSYGFDIAGAVGQHLSHWHVLKAGTILTVAATEIEGYTMDIYVKATEPEEIVLLRGEVPLDLVPLEEPNQPQTQQRPPTPIPAGPESFEDFGDMLGGAHTVNQRFTAFSGQGRRLGS